MDSVVAIPEHGSRETASRALVDLLEQAGVVVHALPVLSWPPRAAYRWGLSPAQAMWAARNIADFDLVHVHGVWVSARSVAWRQDGWLASRSS